MANSKENKNLRKADSDKMHNDLDSASGKMEKNPRAHMQNQTGDHTSTSKVVGNRVKDTGAKPSGKDGIKHS